ncbi:MAG: magnesium/cobalt transporter CorA [Cyclobacteriaceae bacterium]
MPRFFRKSAAKAGTPPGTLVYAGDFKEETVSLNLIDYNPDKLEEKELSNIDEVIEYRDKDTVTWLNVDGLHNVNLIKKVGATFNLNDLLLEDILAQQRPKIEEYDNCVFVVLKMLRYDPEEDKIISEQISIVYSEKFLITFQEKKGDVLDPVRNRIRKKRKRIRGSKPDFLAYSIVDTIVDNYLDIIEDFGDDIETNETKVLKDPDPDMVEIINYYKQEVQFLRKSIKPTKELIFKWTKLETDHIEKSTYQYLDDLHDHITVVSEALDMYREMLSDQLTIYHTTISGKMNDIMRVLTIFSAVFIPLTFIAGIYGTNFVNLPETQWKYGYFVFWGVLVVVAAFMLRYFRKKKWL